MGCKRWTFDDCGGFDNANWMVLDPIDSDKLYVCGANKSHRVLDLAIKLWVLFHFLLQ